MLALLKEYQAGREALARRLEELEGMMDSVHGEDRLFLMRRISMLKDEIYCMGKAMDGISRNISD